MSLLPLPRSGTELDAPVGNLFLIDQLANTEQALHLLTRRHRLRWPARVLYSLLQGPRRGGVWAESMGYEADEVLGFDSLWTMDQRSLFETRLESYYAPDVSPAWIEFRVREDFSGLTRPGTAGLLLGADAIEQQGDLVALKPFGYLLAVVLHEHEANAQLGSLTDEHLRLVGHIAILGGWLNTDAHRGYDHRVRRS